MLQKSHPKQLQSLRKWLEGSHYGNNTFRGRIEGIWDADKNFTDFVTFRDQQVTKLGLTAWLSELILHGKRWFSDSSTSPDHIFALAASMEGWIASGIMTVVSSVFPVLPIVILFFVKRLLIRLILILIFTGVFAGTLVFGMHMDPDKTLAITTAYVKPQNLVYADDLHRFAAIQVVFVGSTSNGDG
jgi:hypothetical protein